MSGGPERVFLGWTPSPGAALLDLAAAWLVERFGLELDRVVVAVPGGRVRRALEQALVDAAVARGAGGLHPPEIVTAGRLPDRLLEVPGVPAPGEARTLAWWRALAQQPAAVLGALTPAPPALGDARGWLDLVQQVRGLHGSLAREGHDLGRVADLVAEGEAERWRALARVGRAYREVLAAAGLRDPHEARLEALDEGRVVGEDEVAAVVLVGVVEATALLVGAVDRVASRTTALVFAPPERAEAFDGHGLLVTEAWAEADVPLRSEDWWVVDQPRDQAEQVARILDRWGVDGGPVHGAVVIGVPDEEVVPYLERRLHAMGLTGRDARGVPVSHSGPQALLAGVLAWFEGREAEALAVLVRHPDLEPLLRPSPAGSEAGPGCAPEGSGGEGWLFGDVVHGDTAGDTASDTASDTAGGEDRTPAEVLDDYRREHLPLVMDGTLPTEGRALEETRSLLTRLDELLGDLASPEPGAPSRWCTAILALLDRVYGGRELRRASATGGPDDEREAVEAERRLAGVLVACREVLDELAGLPPVVEDSFALPATAVLAAMVEALGRRRLPLPEDDATIELLGWLELPLESAPGLVVTGFDEGAVPGRAPGDLPAEVAGALGVADERARLARDVWFTTLMVHARAPEGRALAVVSGRRRASGDPLFPSRLVFHAPPEEVVGRLERVVAEAPVDQAPSPTPGEDPAPRALPRLPGDPPPVERMSVTSFKIYLRSPYEFYLSRVVGAESVDDQGAELDGAAFGTLVHEVLESFGRGRWRDSTDAEGMRDELLRLLDRTAARRFPAGTLPAVRVQLAQLRGRLALFARAQARRAAEGWRVHRVEWSPGQGEVVFGEGASVVELSGRIDRIDHNPETGAWALLDYKTGDELKAPDQAHRRGGSWVDLQLPLYGELVSPLALPAAPELGYVLLPRIEADVSRVFRMASWTEAELAEALEVARGVVADVRAGRLQEVADMASFDGGLAAVAGLGLLVGREGEPS